MGKKRWTSTDIPDQSGRVAVVTGGNSGIGYAAAEALAAKGAEVVIACRSEKRGANAVATLLADHPEAIVEMLMLDLADLDSVRAFVERFEEKHDRLDLLINNAGVMMPPERLETKDGFEMQIGTNHLGHFALTLPLLPLLARQPGARVVNVSSSAQNAGGFDLDDLQWTERRYQRMRSYGASKIANMLFTLELQARLDDAEVEVMTTACHPGWTATNLQRDTPVARLLNPVFGMQPWQGTLPTLYAAVSPDAKPAGYYGPDGIGTVRGYPTENRPAAASLDRHSARKLWTMSESLTDTTMPPLAASPSAQTA